MIYTLSQIFSFVKQLKNTQIMATYQKVEVFNRNGKFQISYHDTFKSIREAIKHVLYSKFALAYKDLSFFAGWTFHLVPEDDNIAGKDYTITSGGNIRLLK